MLGLERNFEFCEVYSSNGEKKEEVCFVDITFFGRSAEVANQYLRKGSKILVEGRLSFDQWTDQNGQKRSKHSVIVETMQMLDSKGDNQNNGSNSNYNSPSTQSQPRSYQQPQQQQNAPQQSYGQPQQNYGQQQATQQSAQQQPARQMPTNDVPVIDIDEEEIPF